MRQDVEERCLAMAEHMVRTGDTVRETAQGLSSEQKPGAPGIDGASAGAKSWAAQADTGVAAIPQGCQAFGAAGRRPAGGFCMKKPFLWRIMDNIVIFFSKKWRTVPIFSEKKRENGILRRIHTA